MGCQFFTWPSLVQWKRVLANGRFLEVQFQNLQTFLATTSTQNVSPQ